jgi:hypothetical protein
VGLPHAYELLRTRIERARVALLFIALAGAVGLAYVDWQRSALRFGPIETAFVPQRAADFIRAQRLPAQLFSPYEYGGYLEWRLADRYRLFYDQRSMDNAVYAEYVRARDGRYADVFVHHDIRTVVFYLFTPVLHTIPPIVPALLNDPRWDVVYADRIALVAVRRDSHTLPVFDKARIREYLQSAAQR